jgi:hypothetical protein
MANNLASQLEGLSTDKLTALFKPMNIDIMKQKDDRDYHSMQQFSARTCQGRGGVLTLPSSLQLRSSSCTGSKLGNLKIVIPKAYAETPPMINKRGRKLSPVLCGPSLWEAILPRFFQSLTVSHMMLWKMPLNAPPPKNVGRVISEYINC